MTNLKNLCQKVLSFFGKKKTPLPKGITTKEIRTKRNTILIEVLASKQNERFDNPIQLDNTLG